MGSLGRAIYTVGFWIRETGQAIDRLGCRLQFLIFLNAASGTMDYIIDTAIAVHPLAPLLGLLKMNGKLVMVGLPEKPLELPIFPLVLDEAALCAKCDTEVHAANKLASKHQRLLLQSPSNKLPTCDICQEKPAFIFCVEDRAMFCQDCDEPIHSSGSRAANHQRFLATGIQVALSSKAPKESEKSHQEPPPSSKNTQQMSIKIPTQEASGFSSPSWAVDDLLHFSDFDSPDKKEQLGFGELEWFSDIGFFGEQVAQETTAAAEVPQLPVCQSSNTTSYRPTKYYMPYKKPRLEIPDDDDEHFTVPDLG